MRKWALVIIVAGFVMGAGWAAAHEGDSHEETPGRPQKISGEVVDLACYLSEGAAGPGHRECAQKCIASGLPVGLKSGNELYLLISSEHGPANQTFAPLASKNVTAEGIVSERNGVHLLAVKKVVVNE